MNFIFLPKTLVGEVSDYIMPSEASVRRNYGRLIDELKYEIEMNKADYFQYVGWRFMDLH